MKEQPTSATQKMRELANVIAPMSMVDDLLRVRLQQHLGDLCQPFQKRIFEDNGGALATLSNRSAMAFAMGLISRKTLTDLDALRTIRNRFAHTPSFLHFASDDPKIKKAFQTLGYKSGDKLLFWENTLKKMLATVVSSPGED